VSSVVSWHDGTVPDSNALRSRRKRLHAAGDCSLCRHDARGRLASVPAGDAAAVDAQASLRALAARLEAAHVTDPADAAVARELRATLLALPPPESPDDDPLAVLLALDADVP
jgi:hypothetical protein